MRGRHCYLEGHLKTIRHCWKHACWSHILKRVLTYIFSQVLSFWNQLPSPPFAASVFYLAFFWRAKKHWNCSQIGFQRSWFYILTNSLCYLLLLWKSDTHLRQTFCSGFLQQQLSASGSVGSFLNGTLKQHELKDTFSLGVFNSTLSWSDCIEWWNPQDTSSHCFSDAYPITALLICCIW